MAMEPDETLRSNSEPASPAVSSRDSVGVSVTGSVAKAAAMVEAGLEAGLVPSAQSLQAEGSSEHEVPAASAVSSGQSHGELADVPDFADGETRAADIPAEPSVAEPSPLLLISEPSASMKIRQHFAVPASAVSIALAPESLPVEPRGGCGLFDLVNPVARRALELGLSAREPGFHVFVAADPDVMIEDEVVRLAVRFAALLPTPGDLVYVHDFDRPEAPRPLLLPPGSGPALVEAMEELIDGLRDRIPQLAEAEDIERAHSKLAGELEARNKQVMADLESTARTHGFGVRTVQGGAVQTFPILHGKPLSAEQFDVLDESTKKALQGAADRLTRQVEKAARLVRAHNAKFEAEQNANLANGASALIQREMRDLFDRFASLSPDVGRYLRRVRQALIDDWEDLFDPPEPSRSDSGDSDDGDPELATRLSRFRVNLLRSQKPSESAPVIYDTNPTYPNLFGYLERRARFGALLTDFTRIRPGSLHKAMGGVLVLRASDLLADPMIWERMKRVLRERRLGAEDPIGPLGLYATTLRPEPVPVQVRVVLVGTPDLYDALRDADADFAQLFRLKVEVDPVIERTHENLLLLDGVLMSAVKERNLGYFPREARARLLDLATRLAEDRDRIALWRSPLDETAALAAAAASQRMAARAPFGRDDINSQPSINSQAASRRTHPAPPPVVVTAEDIDQAWRERRERLGSAERHIRELTLRGEVALDTQGMAVGVVNGLSVYHTGDVEFGQPMRITAVVALGREGIVDVEREAQLGGAIHTKGVAILRGYLARMFGQERPLSLRAQLVFEQSYGEIDGDSASSSELFAVLSALADVGIDQGIAVTGSVNQLGELQAIGGVCAKIEGFYDLCAARGLTGTQGVMIPRANLPHLVLREDVAASIERGTFHLYSIEDVADGIEVLTGLPAGDRDASGRFPASSVFGRVERRIIEIAERLRQAEAHGFGEGEGMEEGGAELGEGSDFRILKSGRPSRPAAPRRS
jgi:predicted ATP-dependent protease